MRWIVALTTSGLLALGSTVQADEQAYAAARMELVREISLSAPESFAEKDLRKISPTVLEAIARTPRHRFVPEDQLHYAYRNRPLPIGYGQTISQPYLVGLMTDLLQVGPGQKVLEIGTGSGYQAALLAEMGVEVYTIEIIEPLAQRATEVLSVLYPRVRVQQGDGYYGWEQHAPFDAIIVTAAASHVPPPLIKQLKPNGRMVIPLGASFLVQQLVLVKKGMDGRLSSQEVAPVRFVPLTGKH